MGDWASPYIISNVYTRIVSNIGTPQKCWKALLIGTEKIMQWSKGASIRAAPSTCIRMEKDSWAASVKLQIEVVNEDEWKLLCVVRGYHVYKYVWDSSQNLFNHHWMFFCGMPNFLSVGRTPWYRPTCAVLLHGALVLNTLDIRGLLTISRYMWCHLDVLLVFLCLAIAFERALFPGLPIGHLTIFSLSVDLEEAAM